MDVGQLKLFDMMKTRMDWLGQRQRIISQNVANADTPNYEAKDLRALDFEKVLQRENRKQLSAVGMQQTSSSHLNGTVNKGAFKQKMRDEVFEVSPTGNAVNLEEQMMRQSETAEAYKMTTTIYSKYTNMMKLAVKGTQ